MPVLWFCIVAVMIAMYVVLDGFDLGAGIVSLLIARTDEEKRTVLKTIGPVWDGNEVWLLAGGGVLYFAFPSLYAASFSGFYLPLMMVLWLLILRGCAIEFRNHLDSPTWTPLWDITFGGASALLAIFFGAALGNVVRGVPFDEGGEFFLPLWTNFRTGPETGVLDWYTIVVAVFALAALSLHGALWVNLKTEGELQRRCQVMARIALGVVGGLMVVTTVVTFQIQPQILRSFSAQPWGFVFPALALGSAGAIAWFLARRQEMAAFLSSCAFLIGMLTSAAFGVFPYVLPSNTNPALGLTVYNAAAADYGLRVGLWWWIPGMLLVAAYHVYVYRTFAGKVSVGENGH
ncbi:MAG: cytochrome d ubiquinol oxidase subunit II [Bryobacteraceae bacterium]